MAIQGLLFILASMLLNQGEEMYISKISQSIGFLITEKIFFFPPLFFSLVSKKNKTKHLTVQRLEKDPFMLGNHG